MHCDAPASQKRCVQWTVLHRSQRRAAGCVDSAVDSAVDGAVDSAELCGRAGLCGRCCRQRSAAQSTSRCCPPMAATSHMHVCGGWSSVRARWPPAVSSPVLPRGGLHGGIGTLLSMPIHCLLSTSVLQRGDIDGAVPMRNYIEQAFPVDGFLIAPRPAAYIHIHAHGHGRYSARQRDKWLHVLCSALQPIGDRPWHIYPRRVASLVGGIAVAAWPCRITAARSCIALRFHGGVAMVGLV